MQTPVCYQTGQRRYSTVVSTSTPLGERLPILMRWKGSRRIVGVPCFLPGCSTVVPRRSDRGPQDLYCCTKHGRQARTDQGRIVAEIERIERVLSTTPRNTRGVDRRELEGDLRYLRICLAAYPDIGSVPPARRQNMDANESRTT